MNNWSADENRYLFFSISRISNYTFRSDAAFLMHYSDVIMRSMASQISGGSIVCLLNRMFRRRSKNTSKLSVTGLCQGNPPVTAEMFPLNDVIMGR